jgi:hypothetical protein
MKRIYLAAGLAAVILLGGCTSGESGGTEEAADEPEQTEQASGEVTVIRTVYQYEEPEEEEVVAEEVAPQPVEEEEAPASPTNVSYERNTTVVVPKAPTPQPKMARGNDISCPVGAQQNAAGTRCTDMATGREVGPNSRVTPNPETSATNPCPEMMKKDASGKCVAIPLPPRQITPQQQANRDRLAQLQKEYDGTGPSPWVQHQQEMAGQ